MKKNNKKKTTIYVTILILIAFLTIGYALLSTTLNINGTGILSGNTWDIHWENIQVTEGSTTGNTTEATITSPTQVQFSISLDKPGDYYEFTVDAVNEGTIDGMIDVISTNVYQSNGTTPATLPSAITYSITYDDDTSVEQHHMLAADSYETYKIRVEYRRDIENSELLATNQTYVMKIQVTYEQADENVIYHQSPGMLPYYNASEGCATINTDSSGGGENATMSGLTLMMKNATQGEDDPSWFTDTAANQSQAGVYTRKGTSNDKYPIYYFRGAYESVNNNLIFNNYCWKIVRTTATGGIRIIYNGPASNNYCLYQTGTSTMITTSIQFNTMANNSKYVGYVYDNNGTPTDSNLKTVLETWYNTNMSSVDNEIETSIYCNDTSRSLRAGTNIEYCPEYRTMGRNPSTLCSKRSDAYKLKVGFITVDEKRLAGCTFSSGMRDYLYNGNSYWTGSPANFTNSDPYLFTAGLGTHLDYTVYKVNANHGVRPVVTLKANTPYTGSGTTTDPFFVSDR